VAFLGISGVLHAGDPVPDVDVTVEQNPGASLSIEVRPAGYDGEPIPDVDVILEQIPLLGGVTLSGDKALADLTLDQLPPGWGLRRQGRKLLLEGPPLAPPVRFRLTLGQARPKSIDLELIANGKPILTRRDLTPREVPQRVVAGTLTGTVRLPSRVSPGETIALRALPGATNLPAGGRWVISGTVSDPWPEDDLRHARAGVNKTRSNIKGIAPPSGRPLTLEGGTCDDLAPLAAMIQMSDFAGLDQPAPWTAWRSLLPETSSAPRLLSSVGKMKHDTSKQSIGNIRYAFAISIKEPGVEDQPVAPKRPAGMAAREERQPGKPEAWDLTAGENAILGWVWSDLATLARRPPEQVKLIGLDARPVANGCRFAPRSPNALEILHWARQMAPRPDKTGRPEGKPPKEALHLVTLPDDLRPGDRLSVRYLDEWGDAWVDVPEVTDVEVVPPPAADDRLPTLERASPYAQGGEPVCVCGTFGPADLVAPFEIGSRPALAVSVSRGIAWLQSPAEVIGPVAIRAEGFRGEPATELLRVRAELDQANLFSGQSTPLRIVIEGTERNLPITLTNGTPQIIELEGGNHQTTETSGGKINQITRQVRGLERGAFQLGWELRPAACPCG
jgi:hypothetical protein